MTERAIFKFPIVKQFRKRYLANWEAFKEPNKKEVLSLYRKFLKVIPKVCSRKLIMHSKLEEVKFIFRDCSNVFYIENIQELKDIGYYVLNQIEKGVYPPFPEIQYSPLAHSMEDIYDIIYRPEK